jgi:RHS repeat-associated protein
VVVSARPDNLEQTADDWDRLNGTEGFGGKLTTLTNAFNSFTNNNGWGALDATALVGNVGTWVTANTGDATFTRTVGQAFRRVDANPGGVSYATDALILSMIAPAGTTWSDLERADLQVTWSTAYGGQTTTGFTADPVSTASGNFFEVEVDLAFGPTLRSLQLRRSYNSLGSFVGPFGPGWSSWASTRLKLTSSGSWARLRGPDGQVAEVPMPDGTVAGFEGRVELVDGAARRLHAIPVSADGFPLEGRSARRVNASAHHTGTAADDDPDAPVLVARFDQERMAWFFDAQGRPVLLDEGPGTKVRLTWDGERLIGVAHERGRSISLEWRGDRIVAAVADDGRRISYVYDDRGRLVRVEAPSGDRFYEWNDDDRIATVTDADGVVAVRNVYDELGRVTLQETPAGRRVRFWYRPGLVTEVDDENGGPTNTWIHDESSRLVRVIDGHGEATSKVYDDEGRVIRTRDRRGAVTQFEWDPSGQPSRIEYPNGTVVETTYDDLGRILTTTGPEGGTARFTYEGGSRHPSTIEDPEGGVTRLRVEGDLVKEIVDPDGVSATFGHDAQGRLATVVDGVGATTRMEYHATGQLAAVTTPLGHRTELERDQAGRLVAQRGADGAVTRIERSAAGRVTAVVDPSGARRELRLGADGEVDEEVDPTGAATTFQRDENGSLVQTLLPDGGKWTFDHDALMRVVGVTDPSGSTWLREHDADGAIVGSISPTGVHRKVAVDPTGMIDSVDDGLTKVSFAYDDAGRPVAQVRPDGSTARVEYDRCGRTVAVVEPGGGVSRFEHTAAGRLSAVVGPTGARTTYRYDQAGRLQETVLPTGGRVRFRYDADNRVVRVTGPTGEVTRYAYDAAGHVIAVMAPSAGITRYDYDTVGRPVATTGPDGAVTRYGYDVAGRVTHVVDPNGGETAYEHDVMGRVVAHTDPVGSHYRQVLDPMGRPTETVDPLGRRTTYTYDQAGRPAGRVDPDGSRHWWRWDDSDRLAAYGSDGTETVFRRDLLGRITEVTRDGEVSVIRTWDRNSNLVQEITDTHTIRWDHDAADNVVATTLEVHGFEPVTTRYERDAAGRLVAVDDPAVGRIVVDRDLAGRPLRIAGPGMVETRSYRDGQLAAWSRRIDGDGQTEQSVRYSRDQVGRIVHEQHGDGRHVHYGYDPAGQLVAIDDDHHGAWRFDYDAAGRLVHETTPAGERRFGYDAGGQLLTVDGPAGQIRYEWDACGRRIAETGPSGRRRYHWNALGQVDRITTSTADGSEQVRQLDHDAFGRLARVDDTTLAWDHGRLAAAGDRRLVGVGTTTWAVAQPDGSGPWRPTDQRGEQAGLDPWGTAIPGAGGDPLGELPGGLALSHRGEFQVDGLSWLRARMYDPATRGFLSPDPLPGVPGSPWGANTYHYAANDPVGHVDPLGLQPVTDAQLANIRDTWDDNAFQRYEGYIIAGVLAVAAVALICTGVGGILGGALMGMAIAGAISAGTQQYFNGGVNYGQLAMDMALGAVGGGAGAAASLSTQGLKFGARYAIRAGVDMTVNVGSGMATRAYNGENPLDPQGLGLDVLTGGVSAGGGELMDAVGDARMAARMRPNVNNPLGLSPQDAADAMANPQRLQHATRHLRPDPNDPTGGVIPADRLPGDTSQLHSTPQGNTVYGNWKGSTSPGQVRGDVGPILERPFATFQGTNLGGTPTTGYLGSVNGQTVAVQVFDSGPKAGQVATTVIPSPAQLNKWGIT